MPEVRILEVGLYGFCGVGFRKLGSANSPLATGVFPLIAAVVSNSAWLSGDVTSLAGGWDVSSWGVLVRVSS